MEMSEFVGQFSHGLNIWNVQVLEGRADGAGRGGLLASCAHRVEDCSKGQVQRNIVLVRTYNT